MNNNLILFYDGCHKIYYAERTDQVAINRMKKYGYEVIDGNFSKNLTELWRKSCPLKFVSNAKLISFAPEVNQMRWSDMKGFRTRLKEYYKGAK